MARSFRTPNMRELLPDDMQDFGVEIENDLRRINDHLSSISNSIATLTGTSTIGGIPGVAGGGGGTSGASGAYFTTATDSGVRAGHLVHVTAFGQVYLAQSTVESRYCNGYCVSRTANRVLVGGDGPGALVRVYESTRSAADNRRFLSRIPGVATSVDPSSVLLASGNFEWKQEVGFQVGVRGGDLRAPWIFRIGECIGL